MIKLPIGILVARKELVAKFLDKEFSARTSIKLKILSHEVARYSELYEQERVRLVKKYGVEIDGQITVDPNGDSWNTFVEQLTEVAKQEVDVIFPAITEEELIADDSLKISAHDLLDFEVFYENEDIPKVVAQ